MSNPDRKRLNALYEVDVKDWSLADICWVLSTRYEETVIPPCRICGGELSLQSSGGGSPDEWACSPHEEDPEHPGFIRNKVNRIGVDDHYRGSRFTDPRRGGDSIVMELVRRTKDVGHS